MVGLPDWAGFTMGLKMHLILSRRFWRIRPSRSPEKYATRLYEQTKCKTLLYDFPELFLGFIELAKEGALLGSFRSFQILKRDISLSD